MEMAHPHMAAQCRVRNLLLVVLVVMALVLCAMFMPQMAMVFAVCSVAILVAFPRTFGAASQPLFAVSAGRSRSVTRHRARDPGPPPLYALPLRI